MSRISQLHELQETDSEILAREAALTQIEARLGEREDILAARQALSEDKERAVELERSQREYEWQIDELKEKISTVETKMYSGSVGNPKELVNLQEEVDSFKRARSRVDEGLLGVMERLETLQSSLGERESKLSQMQAEWEAEQEGLRAEQAKVHSEIEQYRSRRNGQVSVVDPKDLSLYQALLKGKGGRAVARIQRNACQGCRISIPLTQIQRTRSGSELVQCPSCERILYAG